MWQAYNPNPAGARVGDCTVRAISKATEQSWEKTYAGLCVQGFESCDMPSANHVWGSYLRKRGFRRRALPDNCPDCYTVAAFCREHPHGLYVLAISGHVVCVCEGDYYDSWDSGSEIPSFFWAKEDD